MRTGQYKMDEYLNLISDYLAFDSEIKRAIIGCDGSITYDIIDYTEFVDSLQSDWDFDKAALVTNGDGDVVVIDCDVTPLQYLKIISHRSDFVGNQSIDWYLKSLQSLIQQVFTGEIYELGLDFNGDLYYYQDVQVSLDFDNWDYNEGVLILDADLDLVFIPGTLILTPRHIQKQLSISK